MEDEILGQIYPDSPFGKLITYWAGWSLNIVEIGTWRGLGSTLCIEKGLWCPDQRFMTIEAAKDKVIESSGRYSDSRIAIIHGRISGVDRILPSVHPVPEMVQFYEGEKESLMSAPCVLFQLPSHIDLLMLDGGEWSTHGDFELLMPRSRIIALDDTHQGKSQKSWRAREMLIALKWNVIADDLHDRNGYFIAKRP